MELLVATWTLRIAVVAALAVGYVSYQSGAGTLDCVNRALAVAVGFTLAGRFLMSWLEPPEVKMLRMRRKREARRGKNRRPAGDRSGDARPRRSASTISRSA